MVALGIIGILLILLSCIMLILNAIKKKKLKVWGIIALVGFGLFIIGVAFSGSETTSPESSETTTPVQIPKETTSPTQLPIIYHINQNANVGSARWIILNVRDRGSVLKASESKYALFADDRTTSGKFIEITLEIENTGKITESWVMQPTLIDDKQTEYKVPSGVYEWIPEDSEFPSELHPGVPEQCVLLYEVSKNSTGLKLQAHDVSFTGISEKALIDLGL